MLFGHLTWMSRYVQTCYNYSINVTLDFLLFVGIPYRGQLEFFSLIHLWFVLITTLRLNIHCVVRWMCASGENLIKKLLLLKETVSVWYVWLLWPTLFV